MDTRWKKHNREAEQEEAEGVEHGAWWVTWLAAWTMLFYVVWAYVKVLFEMTVGVEKATLLTFWTTGKPLPKSLHADFISKFHVKKKKKCKNKPTDFGTCGAPAVLFQPIFWGLTSHGTLNQASLCICITQTVVKINGWGLNWEGKVDNGSALLCWLLIISQAPLASIKENKRI